MSNLTPGAALAKLLSATTPEEKEQAQKEFDDANNRFVENAAREGISVTFDTSSPQKPKEKTG